jgi:hypothetical protein
LASGTINLGTSNQIQGRIQWTSTANTSDNTSTVKAQIQVRRIDSYTTSGHWRGALNVGGTTKSFSYYAQVSSSWVPIWNLTATIAHAANGIGTCYISGELRGPTETSQENSKVYDKATVTLDQIPRYATATSAADFTDDENPVLLFSNPAGDLITSLQAAISSNGSADDIANYRDITKTASSYTFSLTTAERSKLRKAVTGNTYRNIRLYVRSKIGADDDWQLSYVSCKITVVNCTPVASLTVVDTNPQTTALTGDNQVLVRYVSDAKATGTATLMKDATLARQVLTHSSGSVMGNVLTVNAVVDPTFIYRVSDNRALSTVTKLVKSDNQWIPYVKPTCILGDDKPAVDDASSTATLTLTASGQCYNGSFGRHQNKLYVHYRYRDADGAFGSWATMNIDDWSTSTHRYSASALIQGLAYDKTYTIEVYANDRIGPTDTVTRSVTAAPIFDWSKNDFNLNVDLNMYNQTVLRRNVDNNNIVLSSTDAEDGVFIRPNGTGDNAAQTVFYNNGVVGIPPAIAMSSKVTATDYEYTFVRDENKNIGVCAPNSDNGIFLCPNGIEDTTGAAVLYKDGMFEADGLVAYNELHVGSNQVGVQTVLWTGESSGVGGLYMRDTNTINLAKKISETLNGIVLVFCQCTNGTAVMSNFNTFFVSKWEIAKNPGVSRSFTMANVNFSTMCSKVLYINNSTITGHASNATSGTGTSGIAYNNTGYVLRYVLAV